MSRSVICRCRNENCGRTFLSRVQLLSDATCCPECDTRQSPDVLGVPNGLYKHYKGCTYQVTGYGLLTDPETRVVYYHNIQTPAQLMARPTTMFLEAVNGQPRFQFIDGESDDTFPALVKAELERARRLHPGNQRCLHEAYGVLQEEVDEFWDLVKSKKPDPKKVLEELVQVAAMAQRSAEDLGLT